MSDERVTTKETDADLEARVRAAIKVACPWLPDGGIKYQIKFVFEFGRKSIEVDSGKSRNEAKLDILLKMKNLPLAVLELKRAGIALSGDDGAQGMSYARLVDPPAPLVVVTSLKKSSLQLLVAVVSERLGQVSAVLDTDDEAGMVFNRCHETFAPR